MKRQKINTISEKNQKSIYKLCNMVLFKEQIMEVYNNLG